MTYEIAGLNPALFADTDALVAGGAIRVVADRPGAYPCRVTLADADVGDALLLVNFISADVPTPFRASHAIYVRDGAAMASPYRDAVPPFLERRTLSLRGFDSAGMLRAASIATPGEADGRILALLDPEEIVHVDIHNAAFGCFLARARRVDA